MGLKCEIGLRKGMKSPTFGYVLEKKSPIKKTKRRNPRENKAR